MKFGVVIFPGSNCDQDMIDALRHDLKKEVITLWHKQTDLGGLTKEDCVVLPGGFSYGDYLRCGAMAKFSPIMQAVIKHANEGGKVLGICNGFQILCEAQLLPGALLRNDHQKYNCINTFLKSQQSQKILKIPIAHGEGRYYADNETLESLKNNNQIIYKYCNQNGEHQAEINPNGTTDYIAGICNKNRNVFGMMPHPERATSKILGNEDGKQVFFELLGISA